MKTGYVVLKAPCYGFCNDDIRDISWGADCSEVYFDRKKAEKVREQMIENDIEDYKDENDEFEDIYCEVSEKDGVQSVEYILDGDRDQEVKYYIKEVQIMD